MRKEEDFIKIFSIIIPLIYQLNIKVVKLWFEICFDEIKFDKMNCEFV